MSAVLRAPGAAWSLAGPLSSGGKLERSKLCVPRGRGVSTQELALERFAPFPSHTQEEPSKGAAQSHSVEAFCSSAFIKFACQLISSFDKSFITV